MQMDRKGGHNNKEGGPVSSRARMNSVRGAPFVPPFNRSCWIIACRIEWINEWKQVTLPSVRKGVVLPPQALATEEMIENSLLLYRDWQWPQHFSCFLTVSVLAPLWCTLFSSLFFSSLVWFKKRKIEKRQETMIHNCTGECVWTHSPDFVHACLFHMLHTCKRMMMAASQVAVNKR